MTYSDLTVAAIHAALEAGSLLRQGFNTAHTISRKEGIQNLVTEYDLLAETRILTSLKKQFPHHSFLSEEEGTHMQASSDITWIIDPLDGTVNFARHIPVFTVSIAACQGEETLSGVVFQPMTNELFVAEKGKGAFLNGTPLKVSSISSLDQALLATGFPYNVHENPHHCIDTFVTFLKKGSPLRRLGSAALDLSYVAAGRFDTFWEVDLKPWDVAAGILLVKEAGGLISGYDGSPRPLLTSGPLLSSNGLLHPIMIEQLKGAPCS